MIKTFRNKDVENLFQRKVVPRWKNIEKSARNKLMMLNSAPNLYLLKQILGKNIKSLKGSRQGQKAIRINDQFRICFIWGDDNNAYEVEIVDYHDEQ